MLGFLLSVASALLLPSLVHGACECGYRTSTGDIWQYAIVTDFANITSLFASNFTNDWDIQTWNTNTSSHPYQMQNTESNVWLQDDLLWMQCSAYNSSDDYVYTAEAVTNRSDIFRGSFRAMFRVTGGHGAVAGFFTYYNDTNESDIEILTADNQTTIHYSNQPDVIDGDIVDGSSYEDTLVNGLKWTEYIEHRLDWYPNQTDYYANYTHAQTNWYHAPEVPSNVVLNMWSDGGVWSSGPPTSDVVMQIKYIKLYFNTTDSLGQMNVTCTGEVCDVDGDRTDPNPLTAYPSPTAISSVESSATGTASSSASASGSSSGAVKVGSNSALMSVGLLLGGAFMVGLLA
ncbi:hypothetical protein YB2330_001546 [Saitoella coloradoensis]